MPEHKITHEFGVMTFNAATDVYEATHAMSNVAPVRIAIAADGFELGLERMRAFLAWLNANEQLFKLALETEIQNHDLVWDDVWDAVLGNAWPDADDGFLAEYISYHMVEFCHGVLHVWVDTAGLHIDHKIRATVNASMQIEMCELM